MALRAFVWVEVEARALVKLGFTGVWNLDGGMIAWQEAGYPLAGIAKR